MHKLLLAGLLGSIALACSAGNDKGASASPGGDGSVGDGASDASGLSDVVLDDAPAADACAAASYVAQQLPASIMFVLDASDSMLGGGKWSSAALAIVTAIDQDAFDSMSLGLLASPNAQVTGPSCVYGFPVACGSPALPQIAVKPAGKEKSSASTGVRSEIYKWLSSNSPKSGYDGTPLYEALKTSYAYLRLSAAKNKLIAVVITDGTASCASLSARGGYTDVNGCNDWAYPTSLVTLIKGAHDDATTPVYTFVVGVPGADTTGKNPATEPPYSARKALSAYAKAGAPAFVDPTCEGTFGAPENVDPVKSCHFDMSKTGTFDAGKLAEAIAKIRGQVLGCTYELPKPDSGTVDKSKVNVRIESKSGGTDLKKRSDPSDTCATDGCWDYDADGKIILVGKACADAKALTDGKVSILVGCATVVK
ncbi:MAG: hypothetical protein HYV09_33120 [Deltaproteobacteria bacterium]|nr:hypothetical protein [Deltaproteobacteria bacterium]